MGDRVRMALFNKLGPIAGWEVLDPFAGSGALSFEAISRGAASAIAIERDKTAQKYLERNITKLRLEDRVQLIKGNNRSWSNIYPDQMFDLILCDPPYDDMKRTTLIQLTRHLRPDGLMVLSQPASEEPVPIEGLRITDTSKYANARLVFYRPS